MTIRSRASDCVDSKLPIFAGLELNASDTVLTSRSAGGPASITSNDIPRRLSLRHLPSRLHSRNKGGFRTRTGGRGACSRLLFWGESKSDCFDRLTTDEIARFVVGFQENVVPLVGLVYQENACRRAVPKRRAIGRIQHNWTWRATTDLGTHCWVQLRGIQRKKSEKVKRKVLPRNLGAGLQFLPDRMRPKGRNAGDVIPIC